MSHEVREVDLSDLPEPICDFCGGRIEADDQECPALDDGRCRP